ncbi:DUF2058 domain-containing protein [Neiella marina]|uniref:DUF2058 domain-containing protein n=1 Tax=Neiella holothuriorum TaxID=2870530 RepID=A0ABS7EJ00_9GAMM|nr:DUF2058 domain-containing protein [Neiella holothuriorum]MBW8192328.1 DUF2058 domain-containing protein [Neiella holothuriorum]
MAKLSLQEQMLKTGLVSKKKAGKVAKQAKKGRVQAREVKAAAEEKRLAEQEKAKELNRQRDEAAKQKAIVAQIKQLIEVNRIDRARGDISYNFTDGSVVKNVHVDQATQKELMKGRLAIVRYGEGYEVVPAGVADKIAQRDESLVVLNNLVDDKETDEDDPYAEFVVPDDLMW